MANETWPCGHPKSTGNAFDWLKKAPAKKPTFGAKRGPKATSKGRPVKTAKEMKTLATRVNKHDPITTKSGFDFDAKQKLVRTRI